MASDVYPGPKQGDGERSRLAGMLMHQKGILEVVDEDGVRWIAGVLITNLKTANPSDTRPRALVPSDRIAGVRVVA